MFFDGEFYFFGVLEWVGFIDLVGRNILFIRKGGSSRVELVNVVFWWKIGVLELVGEKCGVECGDFDL